MLQTVCPRTMGTSFPLLTEIMTRHLSVVHVPLHTGVGGGSTGKYKFLDLQCYQLWSSQLFWGKPEWWVLPSQLWQWLLQRDHLGALARRQLPEISPDDDQTCWLSHWVVVRWWAALAVGGEPGSLASWVTAHSFQWEWLQWQLHQCKWYWEK